MGKGGEGKGLSGGKVGGKGVEHSLVRTFSLVYATQLLQHQARCGLNAALITCTESNSTCQSYCVTPLVLYGR